MAALIACDIHPLANLRVLASLRQDFAATEMQVTQWIGRWIGEGFAALEQLVALHGGSFAFGDTPTLADCCLVPQLYNAERLGVKVDAFPRLIAAAGTARSIPACAAAHPSIQPDADG